MNSLPKLPITFMVFMTTKGHYNCRTLYKTTLDYIDAQLPLVQWGARVAHIKITPNEEAIGEIMKADLQARGFDVGTAIAPWERGQSHFCAYLQDQIKMSQHPAVSDNPFVYWTDDDYLPICHKDSFPYVLHRMTQLVSSSPDILTSRFLREEDVDALAPDRTIEIEQDKEIAWSKHVNWQPLIIRSRDYHRACKVIEDNWAAATSMHGEALWREVLAPMSRSPRKHAVWLPSYAQCINIGVPHYADVAKRLNLTIYPNPTV